MNPLVSSLDFRVRRHLGDHKGSKTVMHNVPKFRHTLGEFSAHKVIRWLQRTAPHSNAVHRTESLLNGDRVAYSDCFELFRIPGSQGLGSFRLFLPSNSPTIFISDFHKLFKKTTFILISPRTSRFLIEFPAIRFFN